MDLNGDGKQDILSGSYSRHEQDMAGLFQVLWGTGRRAFRAAEVLDGSDGEALILAAGEGRDANVDKICTRPFAVDLDGDGKLDIVSGNFKGTFGFFAGEGKGRFAPESTLLEADGKPMRVDAHSDPFLVDWDGDGDYDLVSGASSGGVFLFLNEGSKTSPRFAASTTLLAAAQRGGNGPVMGDAHLDRPQSSTRVWVDDVDGDQKLDLLIGDTVSLCFPAKGVTEANAQKRVTAWTERQTALVQSQQRTDGTSPSAAERKQFQKDYEVLRKERETFVRDERTGFVWLVRQK